MSELSYDVIYHTAKFMDHRDSRHILGLNEETDHVIYSNVKKETLDELLNTRRKLNDLMNINTDVPDVSLYARELITLSKRKETKTKTNVRKRITDRIRMLKLRSFI